MAEMEQLGHGTGEGNKGEASKAQRPCMTKAWRTELKQSFMAGNPDEKGKEKNE